LPIFACCLAVSSSQRRTAIQPLQSTVLFGMADYSRARRLVRDYLAQPSRRARSGLRSLTFRRAVPFDVNCVISRVLSGVLGNAFEFALSRAGGDETGLRSRPAHTVSLTSVPACRKSLCAEKYGIYFDFEHAKKSTHIDIFQILILTVFSSYF
jgi:hypothetical protein